MFRDWRWFAAFAILLAMGVPWLAVLIAAVWTVVITAGRFFD